VLSLPWKPGAVTMPSGEVVVAVTESRARSYRDLPAAAVAALRLRAGWRSREGAVGLWLGARPLERRTFSISVWQSEDHLRRFLASPEHVAIVRRFRGRLRVRSETWTARLVS
jgi:hypothetical protein